MMCQLYDNKAVFKKHGVVLTSAAWCPQKTKDPIQCGWSGKEKAVPEDHSSSQKCITDGCTASPSPHQTASTFY